MPTWALAGFWGSVAGSALLLGAAIGYLTGVPRRLVAIVMAFGAGVLISALAFDLMEDAFVHGGIGATALGFLIGGTLYTTANWYLTRWGAKHRKRSGDHQPSEAEHPGSGMGLALGALIDGIPESIVIGLSLLGGGAVSMVAVAAVFLSNLPEGLASAAGMKQAGRSARYVFTVWGGIAVISGVAALFGFLACRDLSPQVISAITAVAAGAILAMLAETMIPEAFAETHEFAGLVTVAGFLTAFALSKLGAGAI